MKYIIDDNGGHYLFDDEKAEKVKVVVTGEHAHAMYQRRSTLYRTPRGLWVIVDEPDNPEGVDNIKTQAYIMGTDELYDWLKAHGTTEEIIEYVPSALIDLGRSEE